MFDDDDERDRERGGGLFRMTRRDVDELHDNVRDARDYLRRPARDNGDDGPSLFGRRALAAAESGLGALGIGYLAGRTGSSSLGTTGVPLGAAVGVGGILAVLSGRLPAGWNSHVEAVSMGALDAFMTIWGARLGSAAAARADEAGGLAGVAGVPRDAIAGATSQESAWGRAAPPPQQDLPPPPPADPGRAPLTEAELQDIAQRRMRNHVF